MEIVSKGLNEDIVKYDVLKNWTNVSCASLPKFAKAMATSTDTSNIMTANYPRTGTGALHEEGHGKGQLQQKHLPFKMKSRYEKIVYLAIKIQSHSEFPSSSFYFAHSA